MIDDGDALELLRAAPLEVLGRVTVASNATLLCRLGSGDDAPLAIYKPLIGEAPLWDFPPETLHRREVAAFALDRALGLGMVPPTVLREDAPFGLGSLQLFVEHDPERHYFAVLSDPRLRPQLEAMVLFDIATNNADRKGGHVLVDDGAHIWLCDHGLTFHADPKLRTVGWDFAGEPVPPALREPYAAVDDLAAVLGHLLDPDEVAATARRVRAVADLDRFPPPSGPRPFPWPPI